MYIGVCQQPVESFSKWQDLGVDTLVGIPGSAGKYPIGSEPANWVAAANAAGLHQIREIVGKPEVDAANSLLLAWSHVDEPDLKGVSLEQLKFAHDTGRPADVVRPVPWFMNFAGGMVLAKVPNSPPSSWYQQASQQANWIGSDIYPVSGWNNALDLFTPGQCVDKLAGLCPGKRQFMYVECCRQGLGWLPGGGRSPTVAEVNLICAQAERRKIAGIIWFPIQPEGGFLFDATTPDVKQAMREINHKLGGW